MTSPYKMIPYIRVFESERSAEIIKAFETIGFAPHYDAYHLNDKNWFREQLKCPHRLFSYDYDLHHYTVKDIENNTPLFFIAFDDTMLVNDTDWYAIYQWCKKHIFDATVDLMYLDRVETLIERPDKLYANIGHKIPEKVIVPTYAQIKEPFKFRFQYLESRDTMVYELVRPSYEDKVFKPFTVVVFPYSSKGHKYFFSDIYGSKEWDFNRIECRFDYSVLQEIWKDLGLDGSFTMQVVKDRIDLCYPCEANNFMPFPEPIIYRKDLESVVETLGTQAFGKKYVAK